ncbi:MAG: S9 family peptidase [Paludibacteraceae bacterium]|nr:S9 family peptidase [Paludibacteraceae bacterium]
MKKIIISLFLLVSLVAHADLLDDIVAGKYKAETLQAMTPVAYADAYRDAKAEETYAMLVDNDVVSYSYKTGKVVETLFDHKSTQLNKLSNVDGFILSPNPRYLLVYTHSERLFRHSFKAEYYVYDRKRGELKPLSYVKGSERVAKLIDPVFSPDGKYIAFVKGTDLYIHKMDFHTETAVTGVETEAYADPDAVSDPQILNGVSDWLYEEEFGVTSQYCFSPDSKQLAFIRLDEHEVPTFAWQEFLDADGKALRYPVDYTLRYPKAGDNNAKATACVYDTYYKSVKTMQLPQAADSYLPRLKWTNGTEKTPDGELMVLRMNRDQNKMEVYLCNPKSTVSRLYYKEESKNSFVDYSLFDQWQVLTDNRVLVVSEKDGYTHAYLYSAMGQMQKQLTTGNFDVTDVYGFDEANQTLYYQAADKDPMTRYIYALNVKKNAVKALTPVEGMHSASFSPDMTYFVDDYQSVNTPNCYTLYNREGKSVRELKNNNALAEKAQKANLPIKEFFQFTTPKGTVLNGWILKPNDFDENKKYPVLMKQYSGPASQQVLNRWRIEWEEYLSAELGYVCVCVDPRGTSGRGRAFRNETYMNLGTKEAEDQVYAARYLQTLPYVDAARVGIWGWSYGGYATIMSMSVCGIDKSLGKSPFAFGMAVAPVADWRLYDSGYTERYMRRPQVNEAGYDRANLVTHAAALQGELLIMHGLADDNVHAQNALLYIDALVQEGKQFEMQIYPDDNHFLRKRHNQIHVYQRMLRFLQGHTKR